MKMMVRQQTNQLNGGSLMVLAQTKDFSATIGIASNAAITDDIRDDITKFERDGFIGPVKLYEPREAAELLREIRIKTQNRSKMLYQNGLDYDRHFDIPELSRHICHPTALKYIAGILGPDILLWRTEYFQKVPGSAGTEWHQVRDYSYTDGHPLIVPTKTGWNAFIDLTVWTAFTPATKTNGCMRFLPGSHYKNFYDEKKQVQTGRSDHYKHTETGTGFFGYRFSEFKTDPNWEPQDSDAAVVELKAGEAVIFTASCVHGSLPNTSKRETRLALSSRYVPTHIRVYPGMTSYTAHGETFDLSTFASVLVSGRDEYGHNHIRPTNNLGQPFVVF